MKNLSIVPFTYLGWTIDLSNCTHTRDRKGKTTEKHWLYLYWRLKLWVYLDGIMQSRTKSVNICLALNIWKCIVDVIVQLVTVCSCVNDLVTGQACVHLAASAGRVELLKRLVYYGADINAKVSHCSYAVSRDAHTHCYAIISKGCALPILNIILNLIPNSRVQKIMTSNHQN